MNRLREQYKYNDKHICFTCEYAKLDVITKLTGAEHLIANCHVPYDKMPYAGEQGKDSSGTILSCPAYQKEKDAGDDDDDIYAPYGMVT